MIRRIFPFLLIALTLPFWMLNAQDSRQGEAPSAPLKVGVNPWPPCQFWALAREKSLLDKARARIEVVPFPTWRAAISAFSAGQLDAVHEAIATTLVESAHGGPPRKIVMPTDLALSDGIVARPGIKTLSDLKGKTVGVEVGTEEHYMLLAALDKAGLPKETVTIKDFCFSEGLKALAAQKLDALVTWEPYLTAVRKRINGTIIYKASDQSPLVDVLVFSQKALTERSDDVLNAMRAYLAAMAEWEAHPTECNDIMAKAQGVSPPEFRRALAGMMIFTAKPSLRLLQSGELEARMEDCKAFLLRAKIISKDVDVRSLIDASVLSRATEPAP